jgi:hypothetical protein
VKPAEEEPAPTPKSDSSPSRTPIWIGLALAIFVIVALFLFWRYRISRASKKRAKEEAAKPPSFIANRASSTSVSRNPGYVKYSRAVEPGEQNHVHFAHPSYTYEEQHNYAEGYEDPLDAPVCSNCGYYLHSCHCGYAV